MGYNVQPLRSQQEINDFLFCLRRNKNAERDVFLFLIGINSGLRMSDIVKLKKKDVITSKNPRIVEQKTGKTRILYLSSLQDLIHGYTAALDPEAYLFPSTKGGHLEVKLCCISARSVDIAAHSSLSVKNLSDGAIRRASLIIWGLAIISRIDTGYG